MVRNVADVQQIIEVSPYKVLFVNESDILELNVFTRNVKSIGKRKGNEFVDYSNGLIFCKVDHYIIQNENEFSTKFTVLDSKRTVVKELWFFETIRPLYIERDIIVATTAVDFLEKHFYKIDIVRGDMEEIFLEDIPNKRDLGVNVEEDIFGNVWVNYSTRDIAKIIIATLKPNLKTMLKSIPIKVPRPALMP